MSTERRGHTMTVPEWAWQWACKRWGVTNPSSRLWDLLAEAISDLISQGDFSRDDGREDEGEEKEDKGHIFTARKSGMCPWCDNSFTSGSDIGVYKGKYYHVVNAEGDYCFDEARRAARKRDAGGRK